MEAPPEPAEWQDTRQRAVNFATRWAGESREQGEKDTFWNELLAVFGVDRRQVARFEPIARRYTTHSHGFIDLFWPGRMLVEHKSLGLDLELAMQQAMDYLPGMEEEEVPQVVIVCDFAHFIIKDLSAGTTASFNLEDLPDHLAAFGVLAGRSRTSHGPEEDVNLRAVELLTGFGDSLKALGYQEHAQRVLLTRVLFCVFADDAAVWPKDLFEDFIRLRTRRDGTDLGQQLAYLFQLLDTPPPQRRPDLGDELVDFTYINGGLFSEVIPIAEANAAMRQALLDASRFNWAAISPAIFGSMFQNALTPKDRRQLGAHYTTERNILRTIRPLFLDALSAQLEACDKDLTKLRKFRDSLGKLTFFDPACGCGNFLVIAYREVRRIELRCLVRIRDAEARGRRRRTAGAGQGALDVTWESVVHVGQFYGIEIEEWPCRIAETAMHLTDHLANQELSAELGEYYARFPINDTATIVNANALRHDWNEVLPAKHCSYLFGNPPFAGQKTRGADQTADLKLIWGSAYSRYLDYVSGWYLLAARYLGRNKKCAAAFVSTNSVVQGEQVARMWRSLLSADIKIDFAHRTFVWTSEARGRANVHVVIVGFSHEDRRQVARTIFEYPSISSEPDPLVVQHINPYLLPLPDVLVEAVESPLAPDLPAAQYGNKPADGGFLIFEQDKLPPEGDAARPYIRELIGAHELTHSETRYCIWMTAPDPAAVSSSAFLRERLEKVQQFRSSSTAADTRKTATVPWRFFRTPQPSLPYLAIPRHVTGVRQWFTVALQNPDVIASDALFTVVDPDGFLFGVLSSAMYVAWLKTVGGKIKSDPRFSGPMVHNTFPMPSPSAADRARVVAAGDALRDARASLAPRSLADIYESLSVPTVITSAHRELDKAVDRLWSLGARKSLATTEERMAVLFPAYEKMLGRLDVPAGRAAPRKRAAAKRR